MVSKCIIVEDEPLASERLRSFIAKVKWLELTGCFSNALEALDHLKTNAVDVLFLDVEMEELTGIQLLESASIDAHVIITTAYDKYALKGYDLNVTDYLLKPFTFERFLQAIDKVTPAAHSNRSHPHKEFLFVKTENRLERVAWKEILFIEGMRDYRRIHTLQTKIMTLQTFGEFEKAFPSDVICRVHKSYMVAMDKIDSLERNRIRIGDHYIPISESYKNAFFELIKA